MLRWVMNINGLDGRSEKNGGVGFIIKRSLQCERIICESEDVCFLKVGTHAKRYEWLLFFCTKSNVLCTINSPVYVYWKQQTK